MVTIWKKDHETGYYKVNERAVSAMLPVPLTTFPLGEALDLLQLGVFFSLSGMSRHWREISHFQIGAGI